MENGLKYIFDKNHNLPAELNILFDGFIDPVIIFDASGIITKVNKPAITALQFNPLELNGIDLAKKTRSCFLACNEKPEKSVLSKILKGNIVKNAAFSFLDIHGKKKYYTCSGSPIRDPGRITGAILIWHDNSKEKEKEQQLKLSNKELKTRINEINKKQKLSDKKIKSDKKEIDIKDSQIMVTNKLLEIIFSNTHFLIAYLATDFTFIQVNDAYARAFSQTPHFFLNKNHFDLFPCEENRIIFENVVKSGRSYITYSEPFFDSGRPDPESTYWDWSLQPIKNNDEVEGIILVLIDVTRRKKAEEDLFNAKRLSDIGTLAATVAHELRNPLGVIQAAAYNIKRKRQNTGIDKHIENINAKVEESELIINNLLSYSKLKIPQRSKTPIYNFLNELCDDIMSKKTNETITFIRNFDVLKDTIIPIDPIQIREVLNNIINNAYQSLFLTDGRIEILGDLSNSNQLLLHIIDNGDGIEKDDLEKIFNPFFTNRSKGTGLGLTISRELIKLHHGNIEIESKKGEGTIVKISLPLHVIE
ncbi:MAG: PAS domain S-box protein [Spirochaetales bacterium]|nr:PAS domain S-box protein [Spirochaetales bacterium]